MSGTNPMSGALLSAVKPLAKKYVNRENISQVFDRIAGQCDLTEGEKPAVIISRGSDGEVCGAVYGLTGKLVSSQYTERVPIDHLIMQLLN